MKNLLIPQYHFLPVNNVGVKQMTGYCKYLPEFGWNPLVLSELWTEERCARGSEWGLSFEPELIEQYKEFIHIYSCESLPYESSLLSFHHWLTSKTENTNIEEPVIARGAKRTEAISRHRAALSRLALLPVRKLLSVGSSLYGEYPDKFVGWIDPAVKQGLELAKKLDVKAILTNCPPQTNHIVAFQISNKTGIPWIPYFGDLYGYYFGSGDIHDKAVLRTVAYLQHRRWMGPARKAFAVSPYMCEYLKKWYSLDTELVVVGFDPSNFSNAPKANPSKLVLSHMGSIYPTSQKPQILFDALDRLLSEKPELENFLEVKFYGSKCEPWLKELLASRPCSRITRVISKVSQSESIKAQTESDILLLFNLGGVGDPPRTLSYPSKIFEYLGAKRRILGIPGDKDWVDTLLKKTNAGLVANSSEEGYHILRDWFQEWQSTHSLSWKGIESEAAHFTHREQARKIASSLDEVTFFEPAKKRRVIFSKKKI
jgi:hypothetical protein